MLQLQLELQPHRRLTPPRRCHIATRRQTQSCISIAAEATPSAVLCGISCNLDKSLAHHVSVAYETAARFFGYRDQHTASGTRTQLAMCCLPLAAPSLAAIPSCMQICLTRLSWPGAPLFPQPRERGWYRAMCALCELARNACPHAELVFLLEILRTSSPTTLTDVPLGSPAPSFGVAMCSDRRKVH